MSLILNIDTSIDQAIVSLAENGKILEQAINDNQREHAGFIHDAIKNLADSVNISLNAVDAIAVTEGPGSYTGLRVGMSTAKGLCYALQKPLITINSLKMIAYDAILNVNSDSCQFFCPMIDARRMEVFTAVYNKELETVMEPCAMILDENSFQDLLAVDTICFSGNGSAKFQEKLLSAKAVFSSSIDLGNALNKLSYKYFCNQQFSNLAMTEPCYVKDYFNAN